MNAEQERRSKMLFEFECIALRGIMGRESGRHETLYRSDHDQEKALAAEAHAIAKELLRLHFEALERADDGWQEISLGDCKAPGKQRITITAQAKCQGCGAVYASRGGHCPRCGKWNEKAELIC